MVDTRCRAFNGMRSEPLVPWQGHPSEFFPGASGPDETSITRLPFHLAVRGISLLYLGHDLGHGGHSVSAALDEHEVRWYRIPWASKVGPMLVSEEVSVTLPCSYRNDLQAPASSSTKALRKVQSRYHSSGSVRTTRKRQGLSCLSKYGLAKD